MSIRKYPNSDFYKKPHFLVSVVDAFNLTFSTIILLSPIIGYFIGGVWGSALGGLILFLTVHYWAGIFRENGKKILPGWIKKLWIRINKRN